VPARAALCVRLQCRGPKRGRRTDALGPHESGVGKGAPQNVEGDPASGPLGDVEERGLDRLRERLGRARGTGRVVAEQCDALG